MSGYNEAFSVNGHDMEIQPFTGQGGGLEDLFLWCHQCDPRGDGFPGSRIEVDRGDITPREAQLRLRKLAFKHSRSAPAGAA